MHDDGPTLTDGDAELVRRARDGDHDAFGRIVARYQRLLLCTARVALGPRASRDDAEDAVQDALVLAYVHLHQLQEPARLGPWLRRVAANACLRIARSRKPSIPLDAVAEAAAPGGTAGEADDRLLLDGALACLSEETRLTVTLFYRRELSLEEIAAFQEVPVTTIKSRLRNARLRLRKELEHLMEETKNDIDTLKARVLRRIEAGVNVMTGALSPDGKTFVTAATLEVNAEKFEARISAWEVPGGDPLWSAELTSWYKSVCFTPDGRHFLVATGLPGRRDGRDGRILFLDAATGAEAREIRTPTGAIGLAASRDGARVAAGFSEPYDDYRSSGYKGVVRVYDLASGEVTHTLEPHRNFVTQVAFSPDGATLATSALLRDADPEAEHIWLRADVRLWNLEKGERLHTLERPGARGRVHNITFSPEGSLLAAPGGEEGAVLLWRPAPGEVARTLPGFESPVDALAFSPDGARIATGDGCGRVRVFGVGDGALRETLEGHDAPVRCVAFSPDGATLISADSKGAVRFWRLSGG